VLHSKTLAERREGERETERKRKEGGKEGEKEKEKLAGTVTYSCNFSYWGEEIEGLWFEASLGKMLVRPHLNKSWA
jgi:hypothetical protein